MKFILTFLFLIFQNAQAQNLLFSEIFTKYNSNKQDDLKEITKATSLIEYEGGELGKRPEGFQYPTLVEKAKKYKVPIIYRNISFGDIPYGSVIQGNAFRGGGMPDVYIDGTPQKLKMTIQKYSTQSNLNSLKGINAWFKKIEVAERSVQEIIPHFEYSNRFKEGAYKKGVIKFSGASMGTPISFFVENGSGDCRIYAILLHLALKELDIPSEFIYAKVASKLQRGNWIKSYGAGFFQEDHAMVRVNHPLSGENIILDAYFPAFNGFYQRDINISSVGINESKRVPGIVNTHHLYPVNDLKNYGLIRMEWGDAHYVKGLKWTQKAFEDEFKRTDNSGAPRLIINFLPFPQLLVESVNNDLNCFEDEWSEFKIFKGGVKISEDYDMELDAILKSLDEKKNDLGADCAPFNSGTENQNWDPSCIQKKVGNIKGKFKTFYNTKLKVDSQAFGVDKKKMADFLSNIAIFCR